MEILLNSFLLVWKQKAFLLASSLSENCKRTKEVNEFNYGNCDWKYDRSYLASVSVYFCAELSTLHRLNVFHVASCASEKGDRMKEKNEAKFFFSF